MPVTYKGAIQKKTRRRRIIPKVLRKELEKCDVPLFECLTINQIKKLKIAAAQNQCKECAGKSWKKENQPPRVKFKETLNNYKKSPFFHPSSANSTFDKILKGTLLQPLRVVNGEPTASSITSSSGDSQRFGSAHRYFTRRQALVNQNSCSGSSNSEWSMLFRSPKNASPDWIPSTPLASTTNAKGKLSLACRNLGCSAVLSKNKVLDQLPAVASQPTIQITSTPIVNSVFETDMFLVSPLSVGKKYEFLNSEMKEHTNDRGNTYTSQEENKFVPEMEETPTSGQRIENVCGPRIYSMPEIVSMSISRNLNIAEHNGETFGQENISAITESLGTAESVPNPNNNKNAEQNHICECAEHVSCEEILNLESSCSMHSVYSEGAEPQCGQQIPKNSTIELCDDESSHIFQTSNSEVLFLGFAQQIHKSLSEHLPINECPSSMQSKKSEGTVEEDGEQTFRSLSPGLHTNLTSRSPVVYDTYKVSEPDYTHVSRVSEEKEVETSVIDMPTCADVTAELSLLFEGRLSLSPLLGKNDVSTCAASLSERSTSTRNSCGNNFSEGTSLPSDLQRISCVPVGYSSLDTQQMTDGTSTALSGGRALSATTTLADSCKTSSVVPSVCTLSISSQSAVLQNRLSTECHRMEFSKWAESNGKPPEQCTPKHRRIRPSHYVVVRDVEPGLGELCSSGFRSVYSSSHDETSENCERLSISSVSSVVSELRHQSLEQVTARDLVLAKCGQQSPIAFSKAFTRSYLNKCKKIGEGVYGEVFLCENGYKGRQSVLKIIPIEGDLEVNGAMQKKYEEILSEIVIAMELSNLRDGIENATSSFSEVLRCLCVQGHYPKRLLDLWNQYADEKTSENDSPTVFNSDQLFIILELAHAGRDLEAYVFSSAHQGLSVYQQVTCSLAVAEVELEFEHRDLHWGNVLVSPTDDKAVSFRIHGTEVHVETKGVKATIIDFTLSRMTFEGCQIFNDLSLDPDLFVPLEQCSDYQFQIYTMMRVAVEDDWKRFEPKTNIQWLHYLADKLIKLARYVRARTKVHSDAKRKLQYLYDCCLLYSSAADFMETCLNL
ncbi:uncharacterized protein LOC134530636 isoform X2 [Bacillus rossius redtenbacheri]|uniref:uncharacterized protein LOC134530636 isoform X2 n=1 Tax=Bacillus rossius redtenbacheri TaxID=93214 RepID=UPI002FDE2DDB